MKHALRAGSDQNNPVPSKTALVDALPNVADTANKVEDGAGRTYDIG